MRNVVYGSIRIVALNVVHGSIRISTLNVRYELLATNDHATNSPLKPQLAVEESEVKRRSFEVCSCSVPLRKLTVEERELKGVKL